MVSFQSQAPIVNQRSHRFTLLRSIKKFISIQGVSMRLGEFCWNIWPSMIVFVFVRSHSCLWYARRRVRSHWLRIPVTNFSTAGRSPMLMIEPRKLGRPTELVGAWIRPEKILTAKRFCVDDHGVRTFQSCQYQFATATAHRCNSLIPKSSDWRSLWVDCGVGLESVYPQTETIQNVIWREFPAGLWACWISVPT